MNTPDYGDDEYVREVIAAVDKDISQMKATESLRDTFAAAALTGLTRSIPEDSIYHYQAVALQAYGLADAMLRERVRKGSVESRETVQYDHIPDAGKKADSLGEKYRAWVAQNAAIVKAAKEKAASNHDAAPAARAEPSESSVPLGKGQGTGDTQEPVAWPSDGDWSRAFFYERQARKCANSIHGSKNFVPLYRSAGAVVIGEPQCEGMDEWYCNWYRCPKCGKSEITSGFVYCPSCGSKIHWQIRGHEERAK